MKKIILIFLLITLSSFSDTTNFRTYIGISNGDWRFRTKDKLNEFDKAVDFDKKSYSINFEFDRNIHKHMFFLLGTGYEGTYTLKDNSSSYDIIPLYIGGRIEYFDNALWNPYFVGRIGYPIITNKKNLTLDTSNRNGWATIGFGFKFKKNYLTELSYKQHISNDYVENKEYDARLLALNLGYKF